MDNSKKQDNPHPRVTANPVSALFFWWLRDLFWVGAHKDLELEDMYNTLPEDQSEELGNRLEKHWKKELQSASQTKKSPSLLTAIMHTFGWTYLIYGFIALIHSVVFRVAQPVLLGKLIQYFNPESTMTKQEAFWYAGGLVATSFSMICIAHHTNFGTQRVGMRVRVACCSLMYRKVLRLSKTALGQTAAGQMVNLLSNDVGRFDQLPPFLNYIWIMPIQTLVTTYFMWRIVGVSALIGVGGLFLQTVPVQSYMSKLTSKFRLQIAIRTDERVRLMDEIIGGMQVIKMYAWEKPFEKMVEMARKREIKELKGASYLRGVYLAFIVFSERTSLFITLVAYVLLGNHITPDKVFSLASFCNVLQLTMAIFYPQALQLSAEAKVSIKRIEDFLNQGENQPQLLSSNGKVTQEDKLGVTLDNVRARWTPQPITDTLANITFKVRPGKLCAVVGPVGAGKSSLLQVILGELPIVGGRMALGGEISYSSQEPWLFAGSVRQNILFGQSYDSKRYREVVRACALQRDLELFPHGDKSVVGERGVSLSGGQRARINLARAVYRSADIYLLDDPLSAVDTHVGKHLFDECFNTYLANKTRILITHQLQYLKDADLIVILKNGQIEAQGTYNELAASKVDFATLLTGGKEAEEVVTKPTKIKKQLSISAQDEEEEEGGPEPDENTEMIAKGELNSSLYLQYFQAGSGNLILASVILILLVGQLASSGADYWVTYWTNQEELRQYYMNLDLQHAMNSTYGISPNSIDSYLLNDTTVMFPATTLLPLLLDNSTDILLRNNSLVENGGSTTNETILDIPTARGNSSDLNDNQSFYDPSQFYTTEGSIYIYSICIIGTVIITTLRSITFFRACMNSSKGLHDTMFASILRGTMRFFDTNPSGRVLNRFSKDMGAVDEQLPKTMLEAIQVFLVMSGILVMIIIVNYYFIIPIIIIGGLFYQIRKIYLSTAQAIKRIEGITRSPVFSHLSASLNGLTTIRASSAQVMVRKEFDTQQDLHTSAWYLTLATSTAFGFCLDIMSNIFVACVTFTFLIADSNSLGGFVGLAISQSLILTGMLQHGMRLAADVTNQMTSVERVLQYTDIEQEPSFESESGKKPSASWPSKGNIKFDHTSLRYNRIDPPVLKDLDFSVEGAQKVGIVGRTGAGKSSLIAALFRLANLEGAIHIDDVNTLLLGLHDVRKKISIIPQEPVLFSATLRYNLDPFGEFTDHILWNALEEVELKDSVDSLDFAVNESGSNFSAGQRQLVCLARAIIQNNKILVLDEATANVDPQTDALIQATIRHKFRDCTVLTIAHRLNTIMDSDMVLVMDAGQVVEYDHPHNLLQNSNGFFYKMVQETGKSMTEELVKVAEEAYKKSKTEALIEED